MLNFASDNVFGVHPQIMQAMANANNGTAPSYGSDELTRQAEGKISELFETETQVFFVTTGTAANSLALSALCPPFGCIFCHQDAHIAVDECGAVELFTGGAKLLPIPGDHGKISAQAIAGKLAQFIRGEHDNLPAAISITQLTEHGTLYTLKEIESLTNLARSHGMSVHMDGARFANAIAEMGCSPAEMTWKSGIDALSFGATKNGAMALEAVIFFDEKHAEQFHRRRMRAGQLLSKGRFLAAQMLGYLEDGLWLKNAAHANAMAARLSRGMAQVPGIRLPMPTQGNEVFPIMPKGLFDALEQHAHFYPWPGEGPGTDSISENELLARFVTSFMTTETDIDDLIEKARSLA